MLYCAATCNQTQGFSLSSFSIEAFVAHLKNVNQESILRQFKTFTSYFVTSCFLAWIGMSGGAGGIAARTAVCHAECHRLRPLDEFLKVISFELLRSVQLDSFVADASRRGHCLTQTHLHTQLLHQPACLCYSQAFPTWN